MSMVVLLGCDQIAEQASEGGQCSGGVDNFHVHAFQIAHPTASQAHLPLEENISKYSS